MKQFLTIPFFCFLMITVVSQSVQKTMKRLPDSGQKNSYTNTFGEDNDYTINVPFFIKNNNGTTIDTITGLMWQTTDGGEMTVENARTFTDTLTLGGYTDWRLPTAAEAFSILNQQNNNPTLDINFFTKTAAEYWWTAEVQANDATKIWATNAGGGIGNHPKTETISAGGTKKFHVRAVRDQSAVPTIPNHFTDNGDGTITDNLTQLMWEKVPATAVQTWEQALALAEGLMLANNSDWRLPNVKELQSLNDESLVQPSVTKPYFQNLSVTKYWSSTSLPSQTNKAWYWSTAFGITSYDLKTVANNVLCVRTVASPASNITSVKSIDNTIFYPNPFCDYINLQNAIPNKPLVLYNLQGQLVFEGCDWAQHDFSYLSNGVYFVLYQNQTHKLLKQ